MRPAHVAGLGALAAAVVLVVIVLLGPGADTR